MQSRLLSVNQRSDSILAAGLMCLGVLFSSTKVLNAQASSDFRIETDVMLADAAEPIIQSVTIFKDGLAYDYSRKEPERVTIIHPAQNRIVFLDQQRERQTEINLKDLQSFIERARNELAKSNLRDFLQDCEVVHIEEQSQTVVVGQRAIRYEAKFQSVQNPAVARLYADFANASAYVNAWQAPDRNPPSFARVRLNQVLGQRQSIPSEITRTMFSQEGREHTLRSRLHVSWQLSPEDQKMVEKFQTMLSVFRTELVGEFLSPTKMGSGNASGTGKTVER